MAEESTSFRTFISIAMNNAVIEALEIFQRQLEQNMPREAIRWTPSEQMHLTLKFLGNVSASRITHLACALRLIGQNFNTLRLRAEGLGCFPSMRNPRVIWVGLTGDITLLGQLHTEIDRATEIYAEKEEKRSFHPHLTLGRVRETPGRKVHRIGEVLQAVSAPGFGEVRVSEFCLMRSQLSPKGATHTVLEAFPLQEGRGDQ